MERWSDVLYKRREARGLVNKPHATLDSIRTGVAGGGSHQITRCRCGEIKDVHGCARGSKVAVRAYMYNFHCVRFDFVGVVYCFREGRERDH